MTTRLDPAVALIRSAVRNTLAAATAPGIAGRAAAEPPLVLVACSGGADSLALAAATSFVAPRLGWRAGLVTVDHQLQDGSAKRAWAVAEWGRSIGLDPVEVATVDVGVAGGPEAAARQVRYAALAEAARRHRAVTVLLGHTQDDQAETVLLALARGSGPRGLAGMPAQRQRDGARFDRPMLTVRRADARAACAALGLPCWDDPHNVDPSYARARVRAYALPALVQTLGDGVVGNLARTAGLLAADATYLDQLAQEALDRCRSSAGLAVAALLELPEALRGRVLHAWAVSLGTPRSALGHSHVDALSALVTAWHGQGPTMLPGGIVVARRAGQLTAVGSPAAPPA